MATRLAGENATNATSGKIPQMKKCRVASRVRGSEGDREGRVAGVKLRLWS
jgi:hypothetical protein